ncbi:MAG: hypothetical protein ACLRMZ_17965 [Blautia marasmi]
MLIIIPMMVPFQSYMITLTRLVANLGMTGSKIGYILVSTGLCMPLAVYMIHGFVKMYLLSWKSVPVLTVPARSERTLTSCCRC